MEYSSRADAIAVLQEVGDGGWEVEAAAGEPVPDRPEDGTFAVPNNSISTWMKAPNMKVGTYASGGWRGFSIDTEDGPFQDVHVRRAIAYSLNKPDINEALTSSRGQVLAGLPPLLTLGSDLDSARNLALKYPEGWHATEVVDYLLDF